jgi:hypothetical protein
VAAISVAFGTSAPQATWGTPTDVQVGLNYSYPSGLGGLQPSLALNYSSGSVDENHGWQSASPWVGQGWSLDLGSVSWSQENVTPNGSPTLENVWHISDSFQQVQVTCLTTPRKPLPTDQLTVGVCSVAASPVSVPPARMRPTTPVTAQCWQANKSKSRISTAVAR